MVHNSQLSATDPEDDQVIPEQVIEGHQVSYLTIIGSLMYLMLGTCPNIAYVVRTLSCFSAKPKLAHWEAAKCVLRYIQATKDMELRFDGTELSMDLDFHGYTDAGWFQDPDNSQSTSGFLFMSNRGPISWSSKQQSMVALPTTESEYIGLGNAGQLLAWLRTVFNEIEHPQKGPTQLFCDNQAVSGSTISTTNQTHPTEISLCLGQPRWKRRSYCPLCSNWRHGGRYTHKATGEEPILEVW